MDNLIELATYHDDEYGLVVQFWDEEDNCSFYSLEEINGEKIIKFANSNVIINKLKCLSKMSPFGMKLDLIILNWTLT